MVPSPGTSDADVAGGAAALVADLDATADWRPAAVTLVEAAAAGGGPHPLVLLATRLAPVGDEAAADRSDRDLPRRQRLTHVAELLIDLPIAARHGLRDAFQGFAAALGTDPTMLGLQQRLRVGALDWRRPGDVRQALLQAAGQCATRPLQAGALAALVRASLREDPDAWDPHALLGLATELANRAGVAGGRVAVEVAAAAGPRTGWDGRWRPYLRSLRWHPDPDVASAARDVVMVPE
jgi:hypothetical protein